LRIQQPLGKDEVETALLRWAHAAGRGLWDQVPALFHDNVKGVSGNFRLGPDGGTR
jgi:hypothetical protein